MARTATAASESVRMRIMISSGCNLGRERPTRPEVAEPRDCGMVFRGDFGRPPMKTVLTLAAFAGMTLAAGAAHAQYGGTPGLSYQQQTGGAVGRPTQLQEIQRFEGEEARRDRLGSPEELEEQYGAERMDLARRVADLIERGECRQARELASAAGERSMVIRIRQTCRQR
jgi:hypothetical protein